MRTKTTEEYKKECERVHDLAFRLCGLAGLECDPNAFIGCVGLLNPYRLQLQTMCWEHLVKKARKQLHQKTLETKTRQLRIFQ